MNVSIENRCIWLSPEGTGGNILEEIFKNYDFYSCEEKTNFELKNLKENPHSHNNVIPQKYNEFEVISSVRNPYDMIWSYYLNYYTQTFVPKDLESTKNKFQQFIHESFHNTLIGVVTDSFFTKKDYLNKWKFENRLPDKILKFENLKEGVKSLDFVENNLNHFDETIFDDPRYKNQRFITFDLVYDFETAQKIFNFYKNYFYYLDYDPFSFTKEALSDEDKKKFIHTYP